VNSPFEIQATIELTPTQVAELIAFAIEKKYGVKIDPNHFSPTYKSDYDSTDFSGYKVGLTLKEVQDMGLVNQ
jgi:hypothetical protein